MIQVHRCPITYETINPDQKYSAAGLKRLSPKLKSLQDLPFTALELRQEAVQRAVKLSIQGVQLKLSCKLEIKEETFKMVDCNGRYILKPQSDLYLELPENEDLSMRLAAMIGIEVPFHGLIYARDGSLNYFIQRFDRIAKSQKLSVEDFAQLSLHTRDTKYDSSMEKVASLIEKYCTFPGVEKQKLLLRTLFNFLIGNEDMHLKNFSLITRDNKIELAPAYDLLNTTIVLKNPKEEIALPLNGKKNNLQAKDLINYFGKKKLGLNDTVIQKTLKSFVDHYRPWQNLIAQSFLSSLMKEKYLKLLEKNFSKLF